MNILVQPDAAAHLVANDFERLFGFLTGQDSSLQSLTSPTADTPAHWLTPAVKAKYREVWQHGLQGGLNYYRASPLRPATAADTPAPTPPAPPRASARPARCAPGAARRG
jgi:hypothetical protein